MTSHRPTYHSGALIPLSVARWFFNNPVDRIEIIPEAERRSGGRPLRYHSGSKFIDYHSWGVELTTGMDRQGRASLVNIAVHDEIAAIVAWERANPPQQPVSAAA